jgi:hypothetical protein
VTRPRQLGREKLAAMGVSPGTVNAFYATPGLTPTDKAVIVASLMSLGSAGDRELFIARTVQAETYSEGFAYRRKAELTAAFAKRVSPVRSFFNVNGTPVMQTGAGAVCPWTMSIGAPVSRSSFPAPGQGQIWITGSASQLATDSLAGRGWKIVSKAGARLEK